MTKNHFDLFLKIYQNIAGDELAELRATLQYGIEAVRGVGTPKMDLIILLKLGQILSNKAEKTTKAVERGYLEDRCEALFKFSLYMLRMQNSSRSTSEPFRRLFKYVVGNNFFEIEQEVNGLAEEAITFLAGRYFNKKAFEECIEDLAGIKLPFATYFQAESYRKLTEISDTPRKNKRAYLDKAKEYLKQTLDLLDGPNVNKSHPLKAIVDEDIKRLHNETRKFETNQSMSDSFVSANGRSDLEESGRYEREIETATPVPQSGYDNIERMIRQMMESLNILKEDVAEVRNRVQNIEEQLNKDDEIDDVDILDDYYLDGELHNQNHNLNNTSMMANVSRNQTFNQQTPKSSQIPKNSLQLNARSTPTTAFPHQNQMGLNSSFNMNPLMSNLYGQMNPYQAALVNAASQNYNQSPQLATNFQSPILPYGNDVYNLHQQMIAAQQFANTDARNPNLMGLLQQQQLQQHNQTPPSQPQLGQQQSYAMTMASGIPSVAPSGHNTMNTQPSLAQAASSVAQTPPQKPWNTSFKNAPVEKSLPVNVVITSSDPLPQNISTITTQAMPNFSVTIPPQHIKSNPAVPSLGAALTNPTITAALQDKKVTQSPNTPTTTSITAKMITSTAPVPTSQEQKSIFGNLSKPASSTPFSSPSMKLTPETNKNEISKSEAAKPSPFASFSFGVQSTIASSTANPTKPLFSFSNIGQSLNKTETSLLANAATPETPSQNQTDANTSTNSAKDEEADNYEPTAHFEPVIPLPDLVEVKTGEENEITLFEHRAKLLRYVKETREWKERGIGNMKVMVNKEDPNKVRLLMRREQVLKLCCNQLLAKDTKFNNMPNTEKALTWFGQDYSENVLQVELLAIRFISAEICKQFHNAVVSAQSKMTDGKSQPAKMTSTKDEKKPTETKGFGDQFKPKAGSWTCEMCYVSNQAADTKCLSCGSPKDKNAPQESSTKSEAPKPIFNFGNLSSITSNKPATPAQNASTSKSEAPKPTFSFGNPSNVTVSKPDTPAQNASNTKSDAIKPAGKGFGDQFKPKAGSWSCKACYTSNTGDSLYCACCEEPKDETVPKKEKQNIFGSSNGKA